MSNIPQGVEILRGQLKKDLFNLLLQYPDGILKVNVWALLKTKSNLKISNSAFRIGSMDAAFKLFEDMIHEEKRDGKTFICLNQHFSWESNSDLQLRGLKSSNQSLLGAPPSIHGAASSLLGAPAARQASASTGPMKLDMLSWPHLATPIVPIRLAPQVRSDAFFAQQITAATHSMMPTHRMPGFRTSGPIPSLLPVPGTMYPVPQTNQSGTTAKTVTQSQELSSNDSSESEDFDDDDDDDNDDGETSDRKLSQFLLKNRIVEILMETGPLKQKRLLQEYKKRHKVSLKDHSGCSFSVILKRLSDAIERFKSNPNSKNAKNKIRVKPSYIQKKYPVQQWGQGVGQSTSRQHSLSSSSDTSKGQESVIDLTSDSVIDLTAESSFISLGQDSLNSSTSSHTDARRKEDLNFISLEMNSSLKPISTVQTKVQRDHSADSQRSYQGQQHFQTAMLPNAPAPYESLHANSKPINKKKIEERELNVAPVRRANRNARPTKDQLEHAAQECIEILSESNCYVSCERIEKLLLQRFQTRNLVELGPRYIDQIGCVNEHNRLTAKVNAYVQAFVKVRTICTLYELKECLKEYSPGKDDFSKLNIGPLQRLPIVYQMFKFPTDFEEIPEITTLDVLEHLRNYLTKKNKWTERLDLQDFMEYLVEMYDADDAFQLGVRIRSLPLGVQVLKKAQRDTGMVRRGVTEGFKEQLRKDIETVFQKFRTSVIHTTSDGTWEVRNHYLKLQPETAISEIFQKFNLIMSMDEPSTKAAKKKHQKILSAVSSFLDSVKEDTMAKTLFHLAICVSNTVLEESAMDLLSPSVIEDKSEENTQERVKPTKETLIASLKKYLERCLQRATLNLSLLDKIEEKLAEESNFPSFAAIGYGRFLQFVMQEAKELLEECGGMSVGSGSSSTDTGSGYRPTHTDILSFIHQCIQCGKEQEEDLDTALCNQFNVKEVRDLGYGKMPKLVSDSKKPGQHQYQEHSVVFEVAVGTETGKRQDSKIGMLGHQTKETALACLHNCPLMEDMGSWSHWSLVFEPEFGKLKDFIQKYGGSNTLPVDGGKRLFTYHIAAMETKPGVLLKLTSHTSTEQFEEALSQKNPRDTCGQLLSLIVGNKGIKNSPLALLANQMKTTLFKMHASDTVDNLPGAPPSENKTDEAVNFVLKCLVMLPVKSCVSLANQIFLEPLGQVVGSSKSKFLLLAACETAEETNRLQELGCMLGVGEWTNQIQQKCQVMMADTELVPEEEAELIVLDDIEESEEESDTSSETSSLSSILSDDDDVQIVSVEEQPAIKTEDIQKDEPVVVELSTGDEDTQTEPENDDKTEFKILDEVGENEPDTEEPKYVAEPVPLEAVEDDSDDMEIMTEEERILKECEKVVNNIRREEFGIGIELNEDGQRLKKVQDERLGRSLDRLSKDLYSKDTHFVLELIQNADDNDYPESLAKDGLNASVKFVMQTDGVIVLNNESGFLEKNIRALCDVGRSTKGKHKFGYIGQKGIGFKSVFRVTDRPEVHSNGYHICFDVQSGPMGYILPHWIEDKWEIETGWTTKIVLPLKEEMKVHTRSLAARFNDIHPSLLLFLHRLREITVDNRVENSSQLMRRKDLGNDVIEIEHNDGTDRWLVVKKMLDASKISLQAKSGVEVESTEIALAFPLSDQFLLSKVMPPKQPVFAFLPLRSYGFRFIIQADFDVPSSREDVDRDSAWNQWIRNEIHKLFIEALEVFKNHNEFKGMKALITFLQFIPMEDEILDFFRPVSTQILKQFRAKPCLPTQPNKGVVSWKLPTQVVTVKDSLVREVVTPEFLQRHLDLFYLHREVADMLNPTLIQCLGIESLTTAHLLQIGEVISKNEMEPNSKVFQIAKWLACVYRSLDEFHDNQEIYSKLMKMKIIPLASKEYVCLDDSTVFFPLSSEQRSRSQYRDPMTYLQEDMNTIHPLFLSLPDNEINSQVQKLLTKLSVCQLSPHDVINRHILPILKSDMWKTKNRDTLISYLIYIKEQTEKDASLVNMDELMNVAIVMTNQGEKNPKRDNVHFTPVYGNRLSLTQTFPGYDWCLIDSVYIQNVTNNADKQKWHKFFSRLGVTDFITVRQECKEFDSESVKESPWAPLEKLYPEDFINGCIIEDFSCDEIRALLKFNTVPQTYELQMKSLCEYFDQFWDSHFSRYTKTKLVRKDTKQEREVESSLSIWLKTLDWLPAIEVKAKMSKDGVIHYSEEIHHMVPSSLYYPFPDIVKLMSYTVVYVDVQFNVEKSQFAKFLGLKFNISLEDLINKLKQWGQRSEDNSPSFFASSNDHIQKIYNFLGEQLNKKQIQDLLEKDPVIFVPVPIKRFDYGEAGVPPKKRFHIDVAGQMLCRSEVWWEDQTGLFHKHHDMLTEIHADIGNKHILSYYARSEELGEFFKTGKVQMHPDVEEYAELLIHIAATQNRVEQETLQDVMKIFSVIGELMYIADDDPEIETKKMLNDTKKKKVLNLFKGQNIIPTKRKNWTSLESNPLIADNTEYEQIFHEHQKVHFVLLEESIRERRQNRRNLGGTSYTANQETVMDILKLFGIEDLTAVVEEETITQLFQPCPKLQTYMVECVPLLQRFLYTNYYPVYQSLTTGGIVTTMSKLQCIQTNSLEVRYWLKCDPDIYIIRPESCSLKMEQFIFHRDAVESYGEINKVIARVFSNNDRTCYRELRNFLTDILGCLNRQSIETMDSCLKRYNAIHIPADTEEVWSVPAPIIPEPEPVVEPEIEPQEEDVIFVGENEGNQENEPQAMKSWPPMSDAIDKGFPPRKIKREDQGESKVWPPPKAPDYMKSVKDLPAGVKVVDDENKQESKEGMSQYHTVIYHRTDSGQTYTGERPVNSEEQQLGNQFNETNKPLPVGEDGRPIIPLLGKDGRPSDSYISFNEGQSTEDDDRPSTLQLGHDNRSSDYNTGQGHSNTHSTVSTGNREDYTHRAQEDGGTHYTHGRHHDEQMDKDGTHGGKRRHVSGGSDNMSQPTAKRPALRLGMPVWEKELGEYEEEELASGDKLKLPMGMMFDSGKSEDMPEIGRLGELTVYQYLLKEMDENPSVEFVNWCNEDKELGQPYDFEVGVVTENGTFTVYIEVKSTLSNTKEVFEISYPQIKFAQEHKERFHVYRIFNACNPDQVRLVRIQNLAEKINEKQVRLCLFI